MLKLKTEREFYIALGKSMRKLRHKMNLSPYHAGRRFDVNGVMYYCMEKGDVAPTPYLLYLLMYYTCPEWLKQGRWPYME